MNEDFNTIIIELQSYDGYSHVGTTLYLKYSLESIYKDKMKYGEIKQYLRENDLFYEFLNFDVPDNTQIYTEFYDGFRMGTKHYLSLEGITSSIKSYLKHYSDEAELIIHRLNFKEVISNEIKSNEKLFIDEKQKSYTILSEDELESYNKTIMSMMYETIKENITNFPTDNIVYQKIIKSNNLNMIYFDYDLVNSIMRDRYLFSLMINHKNTYYATGRFFKFKTE